MAGAAVASRAGRQRAQQVDLGEELDEVARPHRTRLHEILMRVAREARAHEDVQHVVHVPLRLRQSQALMAGERARQVGMAAMMVLVAAQQKLGVGIAARADDIVDAAAIVVPAVPVERVVGDGRHRPQIGQRAPQPVAGADMGGVQRARLAAEEALRQVVGVPQVQVADLRTLDADDPEELPGRDLERPRLARRHDRLRRSWSVPAAPLRRTAGHMAVPCRRNSRRPRAPSAARPRRLARHSEEMISPFTPGYPVKQ